MDPEVFQLARKLQTKLERINVQEDRDTFLWVHGFLVALVDRIEALIPTLRTERLKKSPKADLDEARRILNELTRKMSLSDESDSLEQIERELGGLDPEGTACVPAKRKPGPKGLSGGAALPLPDNDLKM